MVNDAVDRGMKAHVAKAVADLDPDVAFEVAVLGVEEYVRRHTYSDLIDRLKVARVLALQRVLKGPKATLLT